MVRLVFVILVFLHLTLAFNFQQMRLALEHAKLARENETRQVES